ncbi:MAG: SIS domain-containing protein [Candidatus Aminicenantes bacterium]|nr:MAG: SIS domain-containing protein [Candidatus Aminicenantes bacterium]
MDYQRIVAELIQVMKEFFKTKSGLFERVISQACESLNAGNKILVFGNGGSAAQAQHFAAELVNKFLKLRPPLPAISLTTDTSALTSIANDTSFDYVFSRQIEALGNKGDIALGLSTSGNSPNVIKAMKTASERGLFTCALTGNNGGKLASFPDILLDVPSENTPRIQEVHLFLLHLLAQEIEDRVQLIS